MKKIILILGCLILCSGCFKSNDVQEEYYKYLEMVEKTNEYSKEKAPCKIEITREESNYEKNHYAITISNPSIEMNDLKVIAFPIGYDYDEIVPNFNILEEVDVTTFNKKQTAIKLNYFSNHIYDKFKVMLVYTDSNNEKVLTYLKEVNIVE